MLYGHLIYLHLYNILRIENPSFKFNTKKIRISLNSYGQKLGHRTKRNAKSFWKNPQNSHRKQLPSSENYNYFVHSLDNYILSACLGRYYFRPRSYSSE